MPSLLVTSGLRQRHLQSAAEILDRVRGSFQETSVKCRVFAGHIREDLETSGPMPLHVRIATQDAIDSHLEITIRIPIEPNLDRRAGLGILYRW